MSFVAQKYKRFGLKLQFCPALTTPTAIILPLLLVAWRSW